MSFLAKVKILGAYSLRGMIPAHPLFHATPAAVQILAHGEGILSNKGYRGRSRSNQSICLTRDITWLLDAKFGNAILVLDRDELKTKFKIEPLDALGYMSQFKYRKGELEERVYTEHIPVRYIKAMITLVKPNMKDAKTEYSDPPWPQNVNYIYFDRTSKKATLLS